MTAGFCVPHLFEIPHFANAPFGMTTVLMYGLRFLASLEIAAAENAVFFFCPSAAAY